METPHFLVEYLKNNAVSPLIGTIILMVVTVAGALTVYTLFYSSINTQKSIKSFQLTDVTIVNSSIGTHLSLSIKNTGNTRIIGLKILIDGSDVTGRFLGRNTGTKFYGIMLNYFEIIATEDDTHVKVERLNDQGQVVATVEKTISSKGGRWRCDEPDLQVYSVTSDKPIAVFTSSIGPDHISDDDFYSLAGTDLWLYIPAGRYKPDKERKGAVFITAYQDNTIVSITDYGKKDGKGDDTQTFTLNRGEFWEQPNIVEEHGKSKGGEVWHIQASKPITVVAGYPEDNAYNQIMSPDMKEYYFPLFGYNDGRIYVLALEDDTSVTIDNLEGSGDWSGTLNKGQFITRTLSYAHSSNRIEWTKVHVSADKPIVVLSVDPWSFGASFHASSDNPSSLGSNYILKTGPGKYLSIIALTPASVTVSGDYSWTGTLPAGGNIYLNLGGDDRRLTIKSTSFLTIYTLAPAWSEAITSVPPIFDMEPGGTIESFMVLPDRFKIEDRHALTVEAYFEDGSIVSETFTISD